MLSVPVTVLLMIQNFSRPVTMLNCQNDFSLLLKWCADNDWNFSYRKCDLCAFICLRPECSGTLRLDGQLLKCVDATSDLGVEVSSSFKWDQHIRTKLSRLRNNFNYLQSQFYVLAFYRRFCMGHKYGVLVSHVRLMEKFHLKCLSWCFGRTDYLSLLRSANCLLISYHLIERNLNIFLAIRNGRNCVQFENYFTIRRNQRSSRSNTVQRISSFGYKRNLTGRSFFHRVVTVVNDFNDYKVFNLPEPPNKSLTQTFFKTA